MSIKMLNIICHQGNAIKTMRYLYMPIGTPNIWNTGDTKLWQGCETIEIIICCRWECKTEELLWKTVL